MPGDLWWPETWITKGREDILKGDENGIFIVVMSKIPQVENFKYVHLLYVNYTSINLFKKTHWYLWEQTEKFLYVI